MYDRKAPRTKNPKSARVSFRCTQAEKDRWSERAESADRSLVEWIRLMLEGTNTEPCSYCGLDRGERTMPKTSVSMDSVKDVAH